MAKREVSKGLYWINKVEKEIRSTLEDYNHFVTDVRFPNEVDKIKELGGVCIHIKRNGNPPANTEEEINDPLVREKSDYLFQWDDFSEIGEKNLQAVVDNFVKHIL